MVRVHSPLNYDKIPFSFDFYPNELIKSIWTVFDYRNCYQNSQYMNKIKCGFIWSLNGSLVSFCDTVNNRQ